MIRRVAVPDRVLRMGVLDRVDYSDAHFVDLAGAGVDPGGITPGELAELALGRAPGWVRGLVELAHRRVLRLDVGPTTPEVPVPGWHAVRSGADEVVYAVGGGLVTPRLIGVHAPGGGIVVTLMRFEHPAARPVWALVRPLHLAILRCLLARAVRLAADGTRASSR